MLVDFCQISSNQTQRPKTKKPIAIKLNRNDVIYGMEHSTRKNAEDIIIKTSGLYAIIAAPQVGRVKDGNPKYIDFWFRLNGQDIPNSNVRVSVKSNSSKDVVTNQTMMPFRAEDIINVMMSVESASDGLGIEALNPKGEPTVPSIIYSMHLIREWDTMTSKEKPRVGVQ